MSPASTAVSCATSVTNARPALDPDFAGFDDQASAVAVQADGKVILAGTSFQGSLSTGGTGTDFALARYIVLSPQEQIELIVDDVQELVESDALNEGQGNSLAVKLEQAIESLDSGRESVAVNQQLVLRTANMGNLLSVHMACGRTGKAAAPGGQACSPGVRRSVNGARDRLLAAKQHGRGE